MGPHYPTRAGQWGFDGLIIRYLTATLTFMKRPKTSDQVSAELDVACPHDHSGDLVETIAFFCLKATLITTVTRFPSLK